MPSAPNLRLTVLVPREQPSRNSTDGQHQPQSATDNSRSFLLVIKDPENVSLGDLANRIKDQWQELWPNERPLLIKQLVNGAYPDTAFTARFSVADIWVDSGRREREGFDQHGIVRVIPVPSSSTPNPTLRHQRAASVFQDVEGAAREAKRKRDSGISVDDSLPRPGVTTPSHNREQTEPQHHQSKRPRIIEADSQSPSPAGRVQKTTSSPVYYDGRRVPSFALPRGHRRHLTNTSSGSPEIGLGLGITASPNRDKIARDKVTDYGIQKPNSMPPPPPRYPLRGPTNFSPLEGSSQNSSPLGTRKPAERPYNSVPRETSRNNDARPRTRAAKKAAQEGSGSGKRSHHARDSSDPKATPKPKLTPDYYLEKDRKEAEEVNKLLKDRKTNRECLPILRDMSDLHIEMIDLKARSGLTATERKRLINIARKRLGRRRNRLEKFKNNRQLCGESDTHTMASEGGNADEGPDEGADESSDEDLPKKNPKRPKMEKRDLLGDFAATCRISSLPAKSGGRLQNLAGKGPNGHRIQVVIGDNETEQSSPLARASSARASQSNGGLSGDAATARNENENEDENEDENENSMTDTDGEDIQFEAEVPKVQHSSPMRIPTAFQRASPQNAPPPGADDGEEDGVNGAYSTAKEVDPSDVAQLVAAIEQVPEQQHSPPGKVGLLGQFIQRRQEAIANLSAFGSKGQTKDESFEPPEDDTSDDDTSDDDTSEGDSKDSDGD